MREITVVLEPHRIEIHGSKLENARETKYTHPSVKIYQIGTFSRSDMRRDQLNYALCIWLQNNGLPVHQLRDEK